jgi:hypothetical protein
MDSGEQSSGRGSVEEYGCKERVRACATAKWRGLESTIVIFFACVVPCVREHQKSNLKLRSKDRSIANAPRMSQRATLLYQIQGCHRQKSTLNDV